LRRSIRSAFRVITQPALNTEILTPPQYLVFLHIGTRQKPSACLPLPMRGHNSLCYDLCRSGLRLHSSKVGNMEQCRGSTDEDDRVEEEQHSRCTKLTAIQ
ncbi:hypothetical protein, partial [Burkholderia multivorans]|uniref:hypothetical protein n=1 Tax=Burkholderia multivorans TaxID=87883 RepID=UPI001C62CF97